MDNLKKELLEEIEGFRKIGHKFLENELSIMEFKKISGGMLSLIHIWSDISFLIVAEPIPKS